MKCDEKIKNRIKRLEGQMRGVLNMIEDESNCADVLIQLKAIKAGVERVISLVATENLRQKLQNETSINIQNLEDALELLSKV